MKIYYKENIEIKNLKKLFLNAEEVYGKDLKENFKKLLFDISLAIIKDEYLVSDNSEDKYLDLE